MNIGFDKYMLQISRKTSIDKAELEREWLKQAKSICGKVPFKYALGGAKVDEIAMTTFDSTSGVWESQNTKDWVLLSGVLEC